MYSEFRRYRDLLASFNRTENMSHQVWVYLLHFTRVLSVLSTLRYFTVGNNNSTLLRPTLFLRYFCWIAIIFIIVEAKIELQTELRPRAVIIIKKKDTILFLWLNYISTNPRLPADNTLRVSTKLKFRIIIVHTTR